MKNRLQFNRIPRLFETREQANEFLRNYVDPAMRPEFIPLVGEPIVARYKDDEGHKQLILAVGKSVASGNVEYHFIDTAFLKEGIDSATELAENAESIANQALDLASAATKDVANYLVILKNMIGDGGVELEDGSYFDDDDPSNCGIYKPLENSNYLDGAKSFRDADKKLDVILGQTNIALDDLSGATDSFIAETSNLFNTIIAGAGLNNASGGSYAGHDETHIINNSTSLDNADVLLDAAVWAVSGTVNELSANTVVAFNEFSNNLDELSAATISIDEKVNELSANTIAADQAIKEELNDKIDELSSNTIAADEVLDNKIDELSANTMAADQALADEIASLDNRKVLGVSAITVNVLENGDSKVSLVINEEDDKILSQNALGLKAKVTLDYVSADKKIYLKGKNDVVISEIDATNFIKDGMLSAASVFTATEADHEQYPELVVGKTYIKLIFNDAGQDVPGRSHPVFISAEDLVDVYTVDPESHTFIEINDYLIKLNVDKENGLASYNYARNISAVTANIISATGLNMGEQGGYPGHDDTHYIKNAGSLDQADVLLDAAIWGNNQGLAELSAATKSFSSATHTVIENILAGTGLNTQEPGEYHGHDNTHYISGATSLDNADVLLDTAIWETSGLVADISNRVDELSAVTREFSANTHNTIRELSGSVTNLSSVTESFSAHTIEALSALSISVDERIESGLTIISGVVENYVEEKLSGITGDIIDKIENELCGLTEDLRELSGVVIDNELVVSEALNDLNSRIIDLSGYTGDMYIELDTRIRNLSGGSASQSDVLVLSSITINNIENINALSSVTETVKNNLTVLSGSVVSLSASVVTNKTNIQNISAATVTISGNVSNLSGAVINLSAATVTVSGNVSNLSGAVINLSAATVGLENNLDALSASVVTNRNDITTLSGDMLDKELVVAAALNDLNSRILELSGNSPDMSNYYTKNKVYNKEEVKQYVSAATQLKYTTSNALTNLTFSEFLTIATITANTTLSIASAGLPTLPANGVAQRHIIIENTGSSNVVVTIANDARVKITPNNDNFSQFAIDAGGRGELNVLITYNGSAYTIYVITT